MRSIHTSANVANTNSHVEKWSTATGVNRRSASRRNADFFPALKPLQQPHQ